MPDTDSVQVLNFLLESGCCKRCALRFVNYDANFDDPESGLDKITQVFKKTKLNPCIICLDLLQDVTLQSMVLRPELEKILEYDCETFVNYISYPKSILIREHSMEIYAKEKFPEFFDDHHIVPLNRAWSLSLQNKLAKTLSKKFDKNSYLQIQFNMVYELENEESSIMYLLENKNGKQEGLLSGKSVMVSLKTITPEAFKKIIPVPPELPTKVVYLSQVSYKHEYIFIAGRYCKYARNLFQTPWAGDDLQVVTNSVQEIIFKSLDNIFNCSSLIFSSSGREDFDVRTLGRGRPFFIKVCDPKITKISYEQFRLVENSIKQTKVVKVRDLQFIDRKYINNIKEGEQFKKKTYKALCIVSKPENLTAYIDKINTLGAIKLQQKTPLRVYHRRSADVREREIFHITAKPVIGKQNIFELDLVTQAGTYVKEFVHGDLGRTTPSLSEIIGGYVDIVALDVMDIHLDFPPSLSEVKKTED